MKLLPNDRCPAADLDAWADAASPGGLVTDAGPASTWSERSRRTVWLAYRRWLGFLAADRPATLEQPPAERITSGAIIEYLEVLDPVDYPGWHT